MALREVIGEATLALTKTGRERALPWLRQFYASGPYAQIIAAFCLYTLDDALGREHVEAFREHEDQEYNLSCEHYFSLIFQINDPELNALVQEHFTAELGRAPWWTRDDDVLVHLSEPFLTSVLLALESNNMLQRSGAVQACEELLGRKFGYDEAQPRAWNDAAAKKCAEALREYIALRAAP